MFHVCWCVCMFASQVTVLVLYIADSQGPARTFLQGPGLAILQIAMGVGGMELFRVKGPSL